MSQVIAIANQKGGVGKTTTSINLSSCLAAAEKKVLLIDLDPQGNTTTGLGLNKYDIPQSIYHVLIDNLPLQEVISDTVMPHLKLVPANTDLVGAELELVGHVSRETFLKRQLDTIRNEFDFIIIDCPPSLGLLTLNALTAAESVIVPVQCEYFAMEGMADLQRTIARVQQHLNPDLKILGIVLTMFDKRNNLSQQVQLEMRSHFQGAVFEVVIPRNVRLSEAPSHGKPVILYDVSSKGAESYFTLAQEVLSHTTAIAEKSDNVIETNQVDIL